MDCAVSCGQDIHRRRGQNRVTSHFVAICQTTDYCGHPKYKILALFPSMMHAPCPSVALPSHRPAPATLHSAENAVAALRLEYPIAQPEWENRRKAVARGPGPTDFPLSYFLVFR